MIRYIDDAVDSIIAAINKPHSCEVCVHIQIYDYIEMIFNDEQVHF